MKTKLFSLLFAIVASVGTMSAESGTCGNHLTWELSSNGVLTISGTGEMEDYLFQSAPWNNRPVVNVVIEEGVTTVGQWAFNAMSSVSSVTFPSTLTKIGRYAFAQTKLTSIDIPASVTFIGDNAFFSNSALEKINVEETNMNYKSLDNVLFSKDMDTLILYPGAKKNISYIVPEEVKVLGERAFSTSHLEELTLPAHLKKILYDCINAYSFTELNLPDEIEEIGQQAIRSGVNIAHIRLPRALKEIGFLAFEGCGVSSYEVDETNSYFTCVDGVVYTKDLKTLYIYPEAKEDVMYTVLNGVQKIDGCGFNGNKYIQMIELPSSLEYLHYCCFANCSVSEISLPQGLKYIGSYAFDHTNLHIVTIPESVETIESEAFRGCSSLETCKVLSETPCVLRNNVFINTNPNLAIQVPCSALQLYKSAPGWSEYSFSIRGLSFVSGTCGADGDNLTWELSCDSILTIRGFGNMVNSDDGHAPWYEYRHNIKTVNLPDGITNIEYFAFYDCQKLTSITIPNSVTKIEPAAFANCYNLQNINLPNSVVSVGAHAFQDCSKLSSLIVNERIFAYMPAGLQISEYTIPEGIESIAGYAFDDQNALTSLTIPASVIEIGEGMGTSVTSLYNYAETPQIISVFVFSNYTKSTCTLYVPANCISLYKAADQWKDFTNILPIPGTEPEETDITVIYKDKDAVELDNEQISLHLPDAPIFPGFTFVGWDVVAGHLDDGITIQAVYTYNGDPTSAPAEVVNPTNKAQKLIREGNVYILRDNGTYSATGLKVE